MRRPDRLFEPYRSAPVLAKIKGVTPATIRTWARKWNVDIQQFGTKTVYNVREIDEAARAAAASDATAPRRRKKPTPQKGARPARTVEELDALFAQLS